MVNTKKLNLQSAFDILLHWKTNNPEDLEDFIGNFYKNIRLERRKKPQSRWNPIMPYGISVDIREELPNTLLKEFGQEGVEELIIYLLEHDNRYENTDTFDNYKTYKPYPSYFIQFAYLLLVILPKRSRRLFEIFWEHQAKVRPGIDEQCTRGFLGLFIQEGITSQEEIQQLLVRDWRRWQEKGYPYYGAPLGPSIWYFKRREWDAIERGLEVQWRAKHGTEPKKWGE